MTLDSHHPCQTHDCNHTLAHHLGRDYLAAGQPGHCNQPTCRCRNYTPPPETPPMPEDTEPTSYQTPPLLLRVDGADGPPDHIMVNDTRYVPEERLEQARLLDEEMRDRLRTGWSADGTTREKPSEQPAPNRARLQLDLRIFRDAPNVDEDDPVELEVTSAELEDATCWIYVRPASDEAQR